MSKFTDAIDTIYLAKHLTDELKKEVPSASIEQYEDALYDNILDIRNSMHHKERVQLKHYLLTMLEGVPEHRMGFRTTINMLTDTAVVLVSGGMDSCVAAALARKDGYDLAMLHCQYGQRTQGRELKAFNDIADYYKVPSYHRMVVNLAHLEQIGGTSLLSSSDEDVPTEGIGDEIPSTYVPFRNGNLLSIAVSWAEVLEASRIYIGTVEQDSSGYPDCRIAFIEMFSKALQAGTKNKPTIIAPLISKSKAAIVQLGFELNAPLSKTWSCYKNNEIACGVCDSCRLRLMAFKAVGPLTPDPSNTR